MERASFLADTNLPAAKLIMELSQAETGTQMIQALDVYDSQIQDVALISA